MIKSFLTSKIIATASAETIVIGLKLVDAEGHLLRTAGLVLATISATVLVIGWANHGKNEPTAALSPVKSAKRSRKNSRRSRAPLAC